MKSFGSATQAWFGEHFERPTAVQERGWPVIAAGQHALLVAPTGSGKTLAAFLYGIDRATRLPADAPAGARVLYVSPLKALVYDIEKNLRTPLAGIARTAAAQGLALRPLGVDVRTGDTPPRERQRQARTPSEILVTTPESLFLLLGSRARATLATVSTVIVDEIHALAPTKRGTHLALSLERLSELAQVEPQRIGLSATVRPADEVARFLGGDRPVEVVDASEPPALDLRIVVPVPDMERVPPPAFEAGGGEPVEGGSILTQIHAQRTSAPPSERGLWPALYPELLDEIRAARSTILFVNSRTLCERLTQRLNDLAGEELVLAHHGSVSHERRVEIEDGLKSGRVRAICATSSLELGVDMGAVDLVLLVESPGSVARGLQRVGRAGHEVGQISRGAIYPKFRGDLLECAVVAERMQRGEIEAVSVPRNPLDVLAQQLVALCVVGPRRRDELARLVRRAWPYRELTDDGFDAVLDMLSGRFPSTEFADLRPRLSWDRSTDVLAARRGTAMVSRMNAGTIPDRGAFAVHLVGDGPKIGELDEEMVYESRDGDYVLLGASTWRIEEIGRDRVIVSPAPGEAGRMPFWKGDGLGRPVELGRALGRFVREHAELDAAAIEERLAARLPLERHAASNLAAYLDEQRAATGVLPTDRTIVVERFRDELGDWRICILSPFGARVHAPWALAIERRLSERAGIDVQLMYTDDGIVLRCADAWTEDEEASGIALDELLPSPEELEELVTAELGNGSLFASLFRENAVRSLLVTRRRPDQRNPLWVQRLKSRQLLATVRDHPTFPVVLETYRQALSDVFDLRALSELLARVRRREVRVVDVETQRPSPFARSLVFAYVAQYLYDGDSPLAERKAQALTLDRHLLRELLGHAELRDLIEPAVLAALERELQALAPDDPERELDRRARDPDELHDRLRQLGDLTRRELARRAAEHADVDAWLATLERAARAIAVRVAGQERWIAAEDAGLYRDALGCAPPAGLPSAFLDPRPDGLDALVRRYARTHGPFTAAELARRLGRPPAEVEPILLELERAGLLVRGELRPGGADLEWCDADVLRRLKRRNLAHLRSAAAPVEASTWARFLVRWHGLDEPRAGDERLCEVVAQLEGLPLSWSVLCEVVLPRRVAGFTLDALDLLAATGRVLWIGQGALGARDGRIVLARRERAAELFTEPRAEPEGPVARAILDHLRERGASFLTEIERAVRERRGSVARAELEAALWDLVWGGHLTNDTFAPLRALKRTVRRSPRRTGVDPLAGGRWSATGALALEPPDPTAVALARARALLERYGVVGRACTQAEGAPGGFASVYPVLRSMDEAGRVQRGFFVEGLAGAQFALPGAVDRLRALRPEVRAAGANEPEVHVLAAIDPAQPYGALVPWPTTGAGDGTGPGQRARPRRVGGAFVVTVDGHAVLYAPPRGKHLIGFPGSFAAPDGGPGGERARLVTALRALARRGPGRARSVVVETIDGRPAGEAPYAEALERAGFVRDYRGWIPDPKGAQGAPAAG